MRHLEIDPAFAAYFGSRDPFDVVADQQGDIFRAMPGRRTLRFEFQGRRYFLKHHTGVGWGEILKNVATLKMPVLGARNEARAIQWLTRQGIPTMTLVAWGERGINPATQESFVITEALEGFVSLEEVARSWVGSEYVLPDASTFMTLLGRMTGRLHRGGFIHKDYYICHYLLKTGDIPSEQSLFLIDLHRADFAPIRSERWFAKDVAGMLYSILEAGLRLDEAIFLAAYESVRGVRCSAGFMAQVRRRRDALLAKSTVVAPSEESPQ